MLNPDIKEKILNFLKKNYPKDFNIQEIADETKIHRNTISTYLKVLVAEKNIQFSRKIGNITLYSFINKKKSNN